MKPLPLMERKNWAINDGPYSISESPKPPLRSRQKAETNEALLNTSASFLSY